MRESSRYPVAQWKALSSGRNARLFMSADSAGPAMNMVILALFLLSQ